MVNGNEKTCLTIDCSGINKNGPDKFRTEANNPDKQVCYFDGQNNNQMFNVFKSSKINQQETEKGISFQIDRGTKNEDTFEVNTFLRQMAQTIITQKSLEVDTDLQKIGMDMVTMLRAAKKEGETKN